MDKELGKILIIDDDEDVLLAAKLLLKKHAHQVIIEKNPQKIPFLLNNDSYDIMLLDMNFSKDTTSGKEGFYWLHQILERDPTAVVIMITAFGDVEMAVRALKEGEPISSSSPGKMRSYSPPSPPLYDWRIPTAKSIN